MPSVRCHHSKGILLWHATCELISTGKFVIHVDEDEPEEVKQAQREAKEDAERIRRRGRTPDTNEMSEGRSADRSYLPSDIGTDIDDDDVGVCPDNPEEDADAIHLLQVKAICVDEPGEASYLSGFIGIILFKVWKVFAHNEADLVKEAGKGGGVYCPYRRLDFHRSRRAEHSYSAHLRRSRCRSQI